MAYVPNVVERTAAGSTASDLFTNLLNFFDSTSTQHWNVINQNTEAFTIEPVSTDHDFHINIRQATSTTVRGLIDPGSSISDPGDINNTPTVSSGRESSEATIFKSDEFGHSTYYITEGDDFIQLLFMDSSETHTPMGCQIGKIINRFWKNLSEGFAIFAHDPEFGTGLEAWRAPAATTVELTDSDWRDPSGHSQNLNTKWDKTGILGIPPIIEINVSGDGRSVGAARYGQLTDSQHSPGTVLDSGNMAFVVVDPSNNTSNSAVIWDPNVDPLFQ